MTDKPYKFCDAHFKANCPICTGTVPVDFPPPIKPDSPSTTPTGSEKAAPLFPPVSPDPVFSDPAQQKVFDAARQYAESVQAVAVITEQVENTKKLLQALQTKLAESKKRAQEALKLTQDAVK